MYGKDISLVTILIPPNVCWRFLGRARALGTVLICLSGLHAHAVTADQAATEFRVHSPGARVFGETENRARFAQDREGTPPASNAEDPSEEPSLKPKQTPEAVGGDLNLDEPEAGASASQDEKQGGKRQTPGVASEEQPPSLTDAQRIRRARNLFEYGDCQSVIDVLENFEELSTQKQTDNLVDAHRMLGVCFHQLDRKTEAVRELRKILYLKPNYELDPFLTPPPVVELFEQLRIEMQTKLDEIDAAQDTSTGEIEDVRVQIIERGSNVQTTPWAVVLLPFGIAQWVNGSPVKAAIFGGLQGALLTMNVAAFWGGYLLAPDNRVSNSDQAILHGVLWWGHIAALCLGGMAYGAGVADAWWNWEQSVEVSVRESTVSKSVSEDTGPERFE